MAAVRTALRAPGRLTLGLVGASPPVVTLRVGAVLPPRATLAASRRCRAMRGTVPPTNAATSTLPPSAAPTLRCRRETGEGLSRSARDGLVVSVALLMRVPPQGRSARWVAYPPGSSQQRH